MSLHVQLPSQYVTKCMSERRLAQQDYELQSFITWTCELTTHGSWNVLIDISLQGMRQTNWIFKYFRPLSSTLWQLPPPHLSPGGTVMKAEANELSQAKQPEQGRVQQEWWFTTLDPAALSISITVLSGHLSLTKTLSNDFYFLEALSQLVNKTSRAKFLCPHPTPTPTDRPTFGMVPLAASTAWTFIMTASFQYAWRHPLMSITRDISFYQALESSCLTV